MIYEDFELLTTDVQVLKERGKKRVVFRLQVPHSPAGELTEGLPWEYDALQMRDTLKDWETRALDWPDVIRLGVWLSAALFPPAVSNLLEKSLMRVQTQQNRLRLRLVLSGELHNIPWEYILLNQGSGEATVMDFLGLMPDVSIVRHQAATLPNWEVKAELPARMVVALSSPAGYAPLKLDNEQKAIEQALKENHHIQPVYIPDATIEKLLTEMKLAHLFHFAGHGDFEQKMAAQPGMTEGEGVLILDDGYGDSSPLNAGQLAVQLRQAGVRVAMLGACRSGRRDDVNVWSSMATALLKANLGAVVGMQYTIRDDSAIDFSREFYNALAAGVSIDEAVTNGRLAISFNDVRGWGTPVLYLRAADGVVFPEYATNKTLEKEREQVRLIIQQHAKLLRGKMIGIEADILTMPATVIQSAGTVDKDSNLMGVEVREVKADVNITQQADVVDGNVTGLKIEKL